MNTLKHKICELSVNFCANCVLLSCILDVLRCGAARTPGRPNRAPPRAAATSARARTANAPPAPHMSASRGEEATEHHASRQTKALPEQLLREPPYRPLPKPDYSTTPSRLEQSLPSQSELSLAARFWFVARIYPGKCGREPSMDSQAARRGAMGEGEGQSRPMREGLQAMRGDCPPWRETIHRGEPVCSPCWFWMRLYGCAPFVSIKIPAMRLAVSVKCWTSSGFKERLRMACSR